MRFVSWAMQLIRGLKKHSVISWIRRSLMVAGDATNSALAVERKRSVQTLSRLSWLSMLFDIMTISNVNHRWTIKKPIGPCHYGIGTLFMQIEYPFRNYNLFLYVYVLSFYQRARQDVRFLEALVALKSKLVDGQIVVERVVPKLAGLSFCKKDSPSELATRRYHEIIHNLE